MQILLLLALTGAGLHAAPPPDLRVNWYLYQRTLAQFRIAPSVFTPGDLMPDFNLHTGGADQCTSLETHYAGFEEALRLARDPICKYDFCTGLRLSAVSFDTRHLPADLADPATVALRRHRDRESLWLALPTQARLHHGYYGLGNANCANAVMLWYDQNEKVRNVGIEPGGEFDQFLTRETVELKPGDELRYGDIILIEEKLSIGWVTFHTEIFIDANISWEKVGMMPWNPWTFSPMEYQLSTPQFRAKELRFRFFHGRHHPHANELDALGGW